MENFINIVFDQKQEVDDIVVSEVATSASTALMEEETGYELYDTEDGKTILTVETHVQLDESESNDVAEKIANKLGEEAVETITAYLYEGQKELLEESADLIFHLLIMLEDSGLTIEEVEKTLSKRMKND